METPKLGQLADRSAGRDAVHVAVAPVTADVLLLPGQRVAFCDGSTERVTIAVAGDAVGIVDPYLAELVRPGERFYLCLFPGTVTGLRHVWTHPAFAPKVPR